jgi:hypothetical protein
MTPRELFIDVISLCLGAGLVVTVQKLSAPKTYDECLMDGIKGIQTDLGLKAVASVCRRRFSTGQIFYGDEPPVSWPPPPGGQ